MIYAIIGIVVLIVGVVIFRKSPEEELIIKAKNEMNARMIGDKTPTFK